MNRKVKKILKRINELYDYSQSLDLLPPRGEGAKMECAKEIHEKCLTIFYALVKNEFKDSKDVTLILLELVEQMLLDKIDPELTVEEVAFLEGGD